MNRMNEQYTISIKNEDKKKQQQNIYLLKINK
jgi:hypothetical protein